MLTKIHKRNEGFTIVETLIVLAIAGLIILIVLLAVPALQRTSRNTNIKSDASAIEGAVNDFESNNNGTLPTCFSNNGTGTVVLGTGTGSGTTACTPGGITSNASIQGSDGVNTATGAQTFTYSTSATGGGTVTKVGPGVIAVDVQAACSETGSGTTITTTANQRGVAILYPIESSSSGAIGCLQS